MIVADILTSPVDEPDGDGHFPMIKTLRADPRCRKLRRTFRRLIHFGRRSLPNTKTKNSGKQKESDGTAKLSANGSDGVGHSVSLPTVSEQNVKEMSFNLGAGFGLFYLAAASKQELDKIKELRTQMEVILQDIKEELLRKYAISGYSDANETPGYSTTDAQEAPNVDIHYSSQNLTPPYTLQDSEITMTSDESSSGHESRQEFVGGMDQLAAELEAELELLQLHLDQEHTHKYSQQQKAEISVEDMSAEGSFSIRLGEGDSQEAGAGDPHGGVAPHELERRLHELLEARQQERISELEAALEHTKLVLREKEIEATWWKDTARFFSQQYPETSQPPSKHVNDTPSLSR